MLNRNLIVLAAAVAVMLAGVANAGVPSGYASYEAYYKAKITLNDCPFGLEGWLPDSHVAVGSGSSLVKQVTWVDKPVQWAIVDGHAQSPNQTGSIYALNAGNTRGDSVVTFATSNTKASRDPVTGVLTGGNTGLLYKLDEIAYNGVEIESVNGTGTGHHRLSRVDFLTENPGVNLAEFAPLFNPANPTYNQYGAAAIGTIDPAHAARTANRLFDYGDSNDTNWRNDNDGIHYAGVIFESPVTVAALRLNLDTANDFNAHSWKNFDLQVLIAGGDWMIPGDWITVGQVTATSAFYWVDMGGVEVSGIRCYSEGAAVRIMSEIMVWSGPPVPEPATMTLLALGGLAMLRRRK